MVLGVETVVWPTAAKKGGKWYRGVVEAVECLMARWHMYEAESSWLCHAAEDAKSDVKGKGGAAILITAVECRNDLVLIDGVARYRFD